jgi:nucleoside-diphosphate-sugar epimerase
MTDALDLSTKRIVVTGGAGFLGQAVVEALEARGATDIFVPQERGLRSTGPPRHRAPL